MQVTALAHEIQESFNILLEDQIF
ncbi:hypothetical protein BQ8482_130213 [Mesorhizobium delmotii]|uniref:Uncharacterized protein n=1 Tax=Mesorhizobium delmotii TaxID=1631247 RepID=A0A2P9AGS1_9HYPH|nr:hypothetical protein BQ8482_130213 [Mesorhizobium delmotii]